MASPLSGVGAILGTALGGPLGGALGSAAGSMVGAGLGAIPALIKTPAEKENERRLRELQRMQEMGTLGLSEEEKQRVFGRGQAQIQGALQGAKAGIRSAGAALGGSGAGTEALRQVQLAESEAKMLGDLSTKVSEADIQRKRELEDEIQARIAAKTASQQEALSAGLGVLQTGAQAGMERFNLEKMIQGKAPTSAELQGLASVYGISEQEAGGLNDFMNKNPEAAEIFSNLLGGK
jgi:hypothetical protein